MSTPTSAITRTASAFNCDGSTPAEQASTASALRCRAHPSAIWLRHELPVQRKSTVSLPSIVDSLIRIFSAKNFGWGGGGPGRAVVGVAGRPPPPPALG